MKRSFLSLFILFLVGSCNIKTRKTLFEISEGLELYLVKGPEQFQFEQKIKWYDYFIKQETPIHHVFLPDSFGLNKKTLNCYYEQEVVDQLDSLGKAKFRRFKTRVADDYRRTIYQIAANSPLKGHFDVPSYFDKTVYIYFNLNDYPFDPNEDEVHERMKFLGDPKEDDVNYVVNPLEPLLFSKNYNERSEANLPDDFKNYIRQMFDAVRSYTSNLTPAQVEAIKNTRIVFKHFDHAVLWISSDIRRNEVYISPHLLRALFVMSANNYNGGENRTWRLGFFKKFKERASTYWISESDANIHNRIFNDYFLTKFSFVVRHELAHIYLQEYSNEVKCDCFAAVTFTPTLFRWRNERGAYSEILETSIRNNKPDLWGLPANNNLSERFKFINKVMIDSVRKYDCEKL